MTFLELTAYISRTFLFLPSDLGKLYLLTFLTFMASLLLRNPPVSPLILVLTVLAHPVHSLLSEETSTRELSVNL